MPRSKKIVIEAVDGLMDGINIAPFVEQTLEIVSKPLNLLVSLFNLSEIDPNSPSTTQSSNSPTTWPTLRHYQILLVPGSLFYLYLQCREQLFLIRTKLLAPKLSLHSSPFTLLFYQFRPLCAKLRDNSRGALSQLFATLSHTTIEASEGVQI
jgi:hypothetical protein